MHFGWGSVLCLSTCTFLAESRIFQVNSEAFVPAEEAGDLFEGDIILPREGRSLYAASYEPRLWPGGLVWYTFSSEFSSDQEAVVEAAIADLQHDSCVRFRRRQPWMHAISHRINFRNTDRGCASLVGFQADLPVADVFLTFPGCAVRGTIQHELLHVLGLWHEHTRHDRDAYVTVVWPNIALERQANFAARKVADRRISGLAYDYASVMHYRALAFSKDKKSATLVAKEKQAAGVMGQRKRFSTLDLAKLNRLYACG